MADPLSVAGVVFSVISLGLQVAGGLSDYLDAVGGRTEELNSAKQQVAEMKDLLLTINDLLPRVQRDWPAPATLVERRVKSCDVELSALHALLSELSQQASSDSGIRVKLAEQKKKLIYPFNRSHISRLEKRLIRVNSALQTALQVAELNISIASANHTRRVYDLVLSMSQLPVMRTQSTSLTVAHAIPQQTVDSGALGQLDSVNITTSSTSKSPSVLSNSTGILENCNTAKTAHGGLSRVCSCRQFRKASYNRHSWGSFWLSYGTSDIMKHLPGCPFSNIDGGTQATKFTVAYIGRSRFFQTGLILSLLSTRSAGGRSISPSLAYYPTVDSRTAPAFRILELATDMFRYEPGNWESEEAMKTLRCCFNSIVTLFCRKQASPKDIDIDGRSLMHLVADVFDADYGYMHPTGANAMATIIANLVAFGVPLTTCDQRGFTPSGILIHALYQNKALEGLLKHFVPEDSDIPLFVGSRTILLPSYHRSLLRNIKIAEASGCGPLSLAAMAGNEGLVRGLLKQDPWALKEVNQFGQTPLHFAINHPSCLRLILDAGGSSMLKTNDVSGYTPLEVASRFGHDTSTQILLASGSVTGVWALALADESCINSLLSSLKQCRDGLKMLALENLTKVETEFFGLHESKVLDDNARKVEKLLLSRGVYIPPQLKTWPIRSTLYPIYRGSNGREKQLLIFNKLWALGFRTFVNSDPDGDIPLLIVDDIMAVRWLIEHGADYWGPLSEKSNITASITTAHFLLCRIGRELSSEDDITDIDSGTLQWVIEKLMQVRISDTCFSCPCFLGGCTPFKAFFDRARNYVPCPRRLAQWWVDSARIFHIYLNEENIMAALRRITFDALEISHTCCNFYYRWSYNKTLITPEDANEINSEQDTLLTLFADLLTELRDIAYEDRCGTPLIVSNPEEFWMNRWLPRITEVLDSLDGDNLTAEERSAAEAAGVIWDHQPVRMEVMPKYKRWSPEYVMEKLDKIMNECTIG